MPRKAPTKALVPASALPDDLVPLPVYPNGNAYKDNPIDTDQARSAIWHSAGSITRAAALLDVSPARLMRLVSKDDFLKKEREAAQELIIDAAEDALLDALERSDTRDETAKWILDRKGSPRGWGSSVKPVPTQFAFNAPSQSGMLAIKWQSDDD